MLPSYNLIPLVNIKRCPSTIKDNHKLWRDWKTISGNQEGQSSMIGQSGHRSIVHKDFQFSYKFPISKDLGW